ncbi:SAM-dependent methyltransferase [Candidatus Nomurabacteria bacterium CG_4_10_14_0_2_um_filter_30_12]|uniref:SAM-dependent methyltransferase n=1 Tax=Candidatus Nomurabacteria bacterium CG_4_10_14_0_2_um_filter_30_12 TaxID=1974727 RepID=A0A2J0MEV4_9BACT|nr:MAG: SAM-dependent methyltransferase [Candidatus Nomurabacteria bacterium CG_4_10_14_0_2_um_filter_30_12]
MKKIQLTQLVKSDDKYDLTIFSPESIDRIENNIYEKDEKLFLKCFKRNKDIQVKPEEIVRQLMLDKLINEYGYSVDLLDVEYTVNFGREKKFADIVIFNRTDKTSIYCVLEIKKHNAKDGKDQLKSYTNATGAPLAIWTNGVEINYYERLDPNYFEPLSDIPKANETIDDVKNERFTYLELMVKDRLTEERKSLKDLIQEMEDEVLANAGVDVFEEVFKLIFTKLYDEMESADDRVNIETQIKIIKKQNPVFTDKQILEQIENNDFRKLEFRSRGDAHHTKEVINNLYQKAKDKWQGIFEKGEPLRITDENHLQICIGFLQNVKLFNSNLQVIDEAFEYLVNKSAKGEKGQYFTPRNVIDMCVYMMNPQPEEYMIDTACGSCGFTVHTLFNVWQKLVNQGKARFANFSNQKLTSNQKAYVDKVFGIDFDEKSVRVARTLNMIAGDGRTNVLHLNTLDYTRWEEKLKDSSWSKTYLEGFYRLLDLAINRQNPKEFNFDIVMANPPFAGDIKDSRLISNYEVAFDGKGKKSNKVSRDVLFIERNLDFLKPGGRMAIVLPQGRFNNTSDEKIRNFIMERARLIAVVGLDGNTFKPHTGTKTSVLFVQKWDDKINPKVDDYEIFMAVSEMSGKDNSGEEIYEKDENGERKLNEHNHLIQKHDLEKITLEFEKWAKEQKLSFWK